MNPADNPQLQTCKNCPEPVAEDPIGMASGMCLSCTRSGLGERRQQVPSSQEKSSEANEPGPETNPLPQTETEQVSGVDEGAEESKNDGTKDDKNSRDTADTGPITAEEGDPSSNSHKPRTRPASKNSDAIKLTPACANCKRAKIRCAHRRVLNEDGTPAPTTSADEHTAPGAQRKTVRLCLNHPEKWEEEPSLPHRQTRGGARKRRLAETEDDAQDVFEIPTEETGGRESSRQHPIQKQARRRGRKPKNYNLDVVEETDTSSDTTRAFTEEPPATTNATTAAATANGGLRVTLPSFPADSLQGSAFLSRHVVLSRELQQKIEDCETKWFAAIEALQDAKRTLNSWVDAWRSGR